MLFSHDSDSMPRIWTGKEDIRAITKTARSAVCNNLYFVTLNLVLELYLDPINHAAFSFVSSP